MRLPKEFEYYLKKGVIRKSSKDKSRAEFLIKESEVSLEGLRERVKIMGIDNKNANSIIKDCCQKFAKICLLYVLTRKLVTDFQEENFNTPYKEVSPYGVLFEKWVVSKITYDIIMEKIRAKLFLQGYSSSGNYSHEGEISYLGKIDFGENEISFLNGLRYYRNSINYYGKILNKEYAENVFNFLNKIINRLK